MDNINKVTPLTLKELKEPLTAIDKQEADNHLFLEQLVLFINGINSMPNLTKEQRKVMTEALR